MRYNEGDQVVFKYMNRRMVGTVVLVRYSCKDKCFHHTVRAENASLYERLRVEPDSKTDKPMCILERETAILRTGVATMSKKTVSRPYL